MGKFKKNLLILGSIGIIIAGGLAYNILNKPNDLEVNQNKKEMIAMYVQDEEGDYQILSSKEFPSDGYVLNLEKSTCKNGSILSQDDVSRKVKVKLAHADQCTLYFDKDFPRINIGDFVLKVQETKEGIPDFDVSAMTDETANGLYSLEDDYGTSYYFRGAVENNYVKFGRNSSGKDMW